MREYIIKIESDEPLPELIGENLRASIKITGDFDEIIRCKDCKYRDEFCRCNLFMNFHPHVLDNGYCSDAKGKEE